MRLDMADEIRTGRDTHTDRQMETGVGGVRGHGFHRLQNGATRLHGRAFFRHDRIRRTEHGHNPVSVEFDDVTAMNSDDLTDSLRELAHRSEYLGWRVLLTETCES